MEEQDKYREFKASAADNFKQYMYYFLIGFISLVVLCFLPMIGSEVGLEWNIPNTTVGWIVWIAMRLIIATVNVLIFYSFMEQAKINVKKDPKYQEAKDLLSKVKVKKYVPRSPQKWNGQQYGRKGVMIFITSTLATIALSQAILKFDWVSMLTYLFTIIMGLILGILQMKNAEDYWTEEFWKYAQMVKEQADEEAKHAASIQDNSDSTGGGDVPGGTDNDNSNEQEITEVNETDDNQERQDLQEPAGTGAGQSESDSIPVK